MIDNSINTGVMPWANSRVRLAAWLFTLSVLIQPASAWAAAAGENAVDFTLPGMRAQDPASVTLADFRGKVIYLDFWASWCAPCLVSMPLLDMLRNRHADAGFEVIAVNLDTDIDDGLYFLDDNPVDYPVVHDAGGETPALYQVRGMPTSFLIRRDGSIDMVHVGFRRSDITMIEQAVLRLLGE